MAEDLVTMSEIARRIDVRLSAVSNWRNRHPTFPQPVCVADGDLFDAEQIATWLDTRKISRSHLRRGEPVGAVYGSRFRAGNPPPANPAAGQPITTVEPPTVPLDTVWAAYDEVRGIADVGMFSDLILGLLYLAKADHITWAQVRGLEWPLRALEENAHDRHPVLNNFARVYQVVAEGKTDGRLDHVHRLIARIDQVSESDRAAAFDALLESFAEHGGRKQGEVFTPQSVTDLVVRALAPQQPSTVLDPACRTGEFLVEMAKHRASHDNPTVEFTAHALSERYAALTRMNLAMHDASSVVDADALDRIRRGKLDLQRFDVVMANPPFDLKMPGAPGNRATFVWLEDAVSSLADMGRGAVIMPGGSVFRGGAEKEVRARMVDNGAVEAIIALPPGLFASTGISVTVWLLLGPKVPRRDAILFIDAGELGHLANRTLRTLSDDDVQRITTTVTTWRSGTEPAERGFSAVARLDQVRAEDYVLTPSRYVDYSWQPETSATSVDELESELRAREEAATAADKIAWQQLEKVHEWMR